MSKTRFSADLFEQMGGTLWQAKAMVKPQRTGVSDDKESVPASSEQVLADPVDSLPAEEMILTQSEAMESVADADSNNNAPLLLESSFNEPTSAVQTEAFVDSGNETDESEFRQKSVALDSSVVLIGEGIEAYWQNDESLEWQLWCNIMQTFGWDESEVEFYDTGLMASEDMVFSTMEQIIDSGSEWVLTMDSEHVLSEQLAEGLQVVAVPDFEELFADPFAKKTFYQTVLSVTGPLPY